MKNQFNLLIIVLVFLITACSTTGGGTSNITTAAELADQLNALSNGSAAVNGDTVIVSGFIGVRGNITVPAGVTLDLTADGAKVELQNRSTLTVNGTVLAKGHGDSGNGWVDGGLSIAGTVTINGNGIIRLRSKGSLLNLWGSSQKLTLDGVTLTGIADNNRTLVGIGNGAELILRSGAITNNTHTGEGWLGGGGVFIGEDSRFTMTGGTISGNSVAGSGTNNGGGVYMWYGTFIMHGGLISNNTARGNGNGSGGGVYVGEGCSFTMSGGLISGNSADNGGGIRASYNGTFIMEGGIVYGRAGSLPAETDAGLANNAPSFASLMQGSGQSFWGTGGVYTKGGTSQTGGSSIGNTNDTLIAVPAR